MRGEPDRGVEVETGRTIEPPSLVLPPVGEKLETEEGLSRRVPDVDVGYVIPGLDIRCLASYPRMKLCMPMLLLSIKRLMSDSVRGELEDCFSRFSRAS